MQFPRFKASDRTIGFLLASSSGCLWFLACTPFDQSYLAWIASVPLLLALDRARTPGTALWLGWWAGVVETAGGFYWLIDLMQRFAEFSLIGGVLVCALFCAARALIFVIFAAVVTTLKARAPMAVLAPLAMTVGEWVVPQVFPCGQWISQAWHPALIQIAELTGPLGVTALLLTINGALYDVLTRRPKPHRPALLAIAVLTAALIFGSVRMRQVEAAVAQAPRLEVGLVQPNFAYTADGEISNEEALRQLDALQAQSRRLQAAGAQLIVWSEGAYPAALPRDFTADYPMDSPARVRRGIDVPLIIGANTMDAALSEDAYNSALLLDAGGHAAGRYDKVRLLAFGEYIPGIEYFPWLRHLLPPGTGQFKPGLGPAIMRFDASGGTAPDIWRLGPVICYEDLLPGFLRGVGRLNPDLLVNLTSDSWFGAIAEPYQHLALAVFGTVELRVAMVRAVNSGISALIDATGRISARSYADDPYRSPRPADGILVSVPKLAGGHTLFVMWGDWFPGLSALLIGGLALAEWQVRRNRST